MYRQAKIRYGTGFEDILWIDSNYAKVGKRLIDKDLEAKCMVISVYDKEDLSAEELKEAQRLARRFDNNI